MITVCYGYVIEKVSLNLNLGTYQSSQRFIQIMLQNNIFWIFFCLIPKRKLNKYEPTIPNYNSILIVFCLQSSTFTSCVISSIGPSHYPSRNNKTNQQWVSWFRWITRFSLLPILRTKSNLKGVQNSNIECNINVGKSTLYHYKSYT